MQVVNAISGRRILLVVETHEYDIKRVYKVDSEDGGDGGNLPSGDDGESRYHKCYEHRS